MFSSGLITQEQLRAALEMHTAGGQKIGKCLQAMRFVTEQQVTAALGRQWACPIYTGPPTNNVAAQMLPLRLLERFRMYPIQYVAPSRTLYMSFSEHIDYGALNAIEQMLECRSEACLVGSSQMDEFLDRAARQRGLGDILFESCCDPAEMARITSGYLARFGADKIRIVACGNYLWVRLESGSANVSILFRRPMERPANLPWNSSRASVPNSIPAKVVAGGADNS